MRRCLFLIALLLAAIPAAARADTASRPWPPVTGQGTLMVHYGEEHLHDADGPTLLPKVVEESARYKPALVTTSGDKNDDGTVDQLQRWKQTLSPYDGAGIPFFAAVGNHDRKTPPGVPPGTAGLLTPGVQGDLTNYKQVFSDRPYPFGDAAPYKASGFAQRSRPADDPPGASSHYFVDYEKVRVIFVDNSCWGIADCDSSQNPPFPTPRETARSSTSCAAAPRTRARRASRCSWSCTCPRAIRATRATPTRPPSTTSWARGWAPAPSTTCASRRRPSRAEWTA